MYRLDVTKCEVITLSSQLAQGMSIIQGVALMHKPSKQALGRRNSLEVLLDLFLVSRHLTAPTTYPLGCLRIFASDPSPQSQIQAVVSELPVASQRELGLKAMECI